MKFGEIPMFSSQWTLNLIIGAKVRCLGEKQIKQLRALHPRVH